MHIFYIPKNTLNNNKLSQLNKCVIWFIVILVQCYLHTKLKYLLLFFSLMLIDLSIVH